MESKQISTFEVMLYFVGPIHKKAGYVDLDAFSHSLKLPPKLPFLNYSSSYLVSSWEDDHSLPDYSSLYDSMFGADHLI